MGDKTASALTIYPPQPGVLTGEMFADFLETNFQKVNEDLMTQAIQGLDLYNVESTNLDHVKHTGLVGMGTVPKSRDSENVPVDTTIQSWDQTYTPEVFRLGFPYERRVAETAQYGLISKTQRALMQASRDTIEYHAADPFNNLTDGSFAFLCADGMGLFDTSRPREDKSTGTYDNMETAAALTENSLETMDVSFAGTKNGRGLLRPLRMRRLVVPRSLRRKALELTKSDKAPEDSLNRINVFKGAVDVIVWDYLTSTTAWFGTVDKGDPTYQLYWVWGVQPSVTTWEPTPDVTAQRIRFVFTTGADIPRGLRANVGA